jgi:hypothetical protein
MFKVRSEQLNNIQGLFDERLKITIVSHLAQNHPDSIKGLPYFMLEDMVNMGIKKAFQNKIKSTYGISIFTALMFEIAPNFSEYYKVKRIFNRDGPSDREKIDSMMSSLSASDWENVKQSYNENAWFE